MSVPYSAIRPVPTKWLWPGRVPFGEPVIIAGPGGAGKGMALIDLAARFTRGLPMPGCEEEREPGSVVLVTPEDDACEVVSYRLRAARADISRVHDLTLLDNGSPFELPDHTGILRATVDSLPGPHLVIIDPLLATCTMPIATNLGARRVFAPVQRLAKETGAAVVISHHTTKAGQVAGSKGLTDAARIVFTVQPDPENPAVRVMAPYKANVIGTAIEQRYSIEGDGTAAHAVWLDRAEMMARRESIHGIGNIKDSRSRAASLRPCKHPWLIGTPMQCSNCPLRSAARTARPEPRPAPAGAPRLAPVPAVPPMPRTEPRSATRARPATVPGPALFAAMRATPGPGGQAVTASLGGPWEDLEEAQEACHADAGRPLAWTRKAADLWVARIPTLAGQVATSYGISNRQ